ncbi:ubiquitin-conjugating enzyme E2 J2-like isoform X2 [Arctopsyche grandis]|uniref:ubiquitin-conjugating enzyme E2 J2-like isoform X2 n=1 Tax=Arctopsyche grandis TaxID=121162 RepID=UPI00406D8FAB
MVGANDTKMQKTKILSATKRLQQDYLRLKSDPVPYIVAEPLPDNWLEWHYVLRGPEDSPFEGGFYHGKLTFPREFPFRPPAIYMMTANGRFKTNTRLCLSISDFHPDTWNPAWSVSTILTGLLSFMLEDTPMTGSMESSNCMKHRLALKSLEHNLKNKAFCELFPETVVEIKEALKRHEQSSKADSEFQAGDNIYNDLYSFTLNQEQWTMQYAITNLCVIAGFVMFGFVIKYVLKNVSVE